MAKIDPERWQMLEERFHEALDRPPDERAAFLDELCAGNEGLRAELQALLSSYAQAGSFLESPAPEAALDIQPESAGRGDLNQRIGPYRLLRPLGRGGMGTVYLAERDDGEYRVRVAVKLVNPLHQNLAAVLGRFRSERQILANLTHPHICRLLDGGSTDEGVPYFVMEHIDGTPLDEYCDRHQRSIDQRLALVLDVCAAVECAHQQGIVHRDIKPGNILVTLEGVPKLLDFGIAKMLEAEGQSPATCTVTALGAMTPEYASPEQVRGEPVGPASDVYALGVLLYRLLTGRSPYRGPTHAPHEIVDAICRQDPLKPSRRVRGQSTPAEPEEQAPATLRGTTPAALSRRLAGDLDAIVLTALCKDPAHRYRSAAALADDIARHLTGRPVHARRPDVGYAAWKLISRSRQPLAATGAVLVALLTGVLLGPLRSMVQHSEAPGSIGAIAVLPFENLSGHAEEDYLAQGMTEELLSALRRISSLRVVAQGSVTRFRAEPATPVQLAGLLGVDALVQGSVKRSERGLAAEISVLRGDTGEVLWRELFERGLEHAHTLHRDVARAIVREIRVTLTASEQFRLNRIAAVEPDAFDEYLKGRYYWSRRTPQSLERAIRHFRNALDAHPTFAPAYVGLADAYNQQGTVLIGQPPQEKRRLAAAAVKRALEIDGQLASAHATLGYLHTYSWDWEAAEQSFRRALELDPTDPNARLWYAHLLTAVGRFDEALAEVARAQELDPLSPIIQTQVGWIHQFARQFDRAAEQFRQVLSIEPDFPWGIWMLGEAMIQTGQLPDALEILNRAATLSSRNPAVLGMLGAAYARAGRQAEAGALLQELLARSREGYLPPFALVWISIGLGDMDQSFDWLEQAYAERSNAMAYSNVTAWFDHLRDHPRFVRMVRRMGLVPAPAPAPANELRGDAQVLFRQPRLGSKAPARTRDSFGPGTGATSAFIRTLPPPQDRRDDHP